MAATLSQRRRVYLIAIASILLIPSLAPAQMAVIDAANLKPNSVTAAQSVATMKNTLSQLMHEIENAKAWVREQMEMAKAEVMGSAVGDVIRLGSDVYEVADDSYRTYQAISWEMNNVFWQVQRAKEIFDRGPGLYLLSEIPWEEFKRQKVQLNQRNFTTVSNAFQMSQESLMHAKESVEHTKKLQRAVAGSTGQLQALQAMGMQLDSLIGEMQAMRAQNAADIAAANQLRQNQLLKERAEESNAMAARERQRELNIQFVKGAGGDPNKLLNPDSPIRGDLASGQDYGSGGISLASASGYGTSNNTNIVGGSSSSTCNNPLASNVVDCNRYFAPPEQAAGDQINPLLEQEKDAAQRSGQQAAVKSGDVTSQMDIQTMTAPAQQASQIQAQQAPQPTRWWQRIF